MYDNDSLSGEFELPLDQIVHDLAVAYVSKNVPSGVSPEQWASLYKEAFEKIYSQFVPEEN